ncbi:MAG TPA: hypothetical protein PKL14_06790 [Holophaga sp.]|jgi:hypothetical protein|nr:hypothetical protein [Holophaga sp.]
MSLLVKIGQTTQAIYKWRLLLFIPLCLGIGGGVYLWYYTHPLLALVNASDSPTLQVSIDGKPINQELRQSLRESDANDNYQKLRVRSGEHILTARDAKGALLDERKIDLKSGSVYFYAPAHQKDIAWSLQTDEYGYASGKHPHLQPLDPKNGFWKLPMCEGFHNFLGPNDWFQSTPGSIKVGKRGSSKTTQSALRQHRLDDPEFTNPMGTRQP